MTSVGSKNTSAKKYNSVPIIEPCIQNENHGMLTILTPYILQILMQSIVDKWRKIYARTKPMGLLYRFMGRS